MFIGGEKYACDACVRGHRASNCQHSDRPLVHISKQGRPHSQCPHCRTLRKSRSAHVKCDCGEKISGKKACTHGEDSELPPNACCCSHGGRCSCALKKELVQPVLEYRTDENSISTASADRSLLPYYPTLFSVDPFAPFANDHQMPFYLDMEMAVAGGLSCVVPEIGSNYASQSSPRNPSTDDHSFLSTIGTRLSFPQLQGPLANSLQEPNLASLTNMEHRPHQSHPRIMSSSGLESIEGQVPPYSYWEFENHSDSFNYPLDFEDPASMADFDQLTSMSIDGFSYNV